MAHTQYLSNIFLYGTNEDKGYSVELKTVTIASGMKSGSVLVEKAGKFVHMAATDLRTTFTPVVQNTAAYTVSIDLNGVNYVLSITSDSDATAAEIVDALVSAINGVTALAAALTASNVSNTLVIVSDGSATFDAKALTANLTGGVSFVDSIAVLVDENAEVDGGLTAGDHTLKVVTRDAGLGKSYLNFSGSMTSAQLLSAYAALLKKGLKVETQY